MWRSQTFRKGKNIFSATRRQLTEEAGGTKRATPPSPPSKPKGSFTLIKLIGIGVPLATGSLLGYAYYDVDFRKQCEKLPGAKELFETVLPPIEESVTKVASKKATRLPIPTDSQIPAPLFEASPLVKQTTSESILEKSIKLEAEQEKETMPQEKSVMIEKEKEVKVETQSIAEQVHLKQQEEKEDNAALEVVLEKLLESGNNWVDLAVKAQIEVAEATTHYSNLLKKAMDDSSNILQKDSDWEAVTVAFKERDCAAAKAKELLDEANESIVKLKKVIDEAKASNVTKKNPSILPATEKLGDFYKFLSAAESKVSQASADAKVITKYKDLVDKGKEQFQMELESLMPDVRPREKGGKLSEEELNTLIAHAHRRIEQLQRQIAEQLAMERDRLSLALDAQREENKDITKLALLTERTNLLNEFEIEKQKLEVEFMARMEKDVRLQLSRQAAAHSDHLKDVLAVQAKEMNQSFDRKMNMTLLDERDKYQNETKNWISRVKGIEAAVDARAASEKLARQAQDLWLACISLNTSIMFGNDDEISPSLIPLKQQVEAVVNSANKHPFVETVAKSIPEVALNRGVYTESELRERFNKVSLISRRLGLVPENSSLFKYFVSFLHSMVRFPNVAAYSEKDLISLEDMDNIEVVAHAQYWIDKGNLEMALRFMSQLTGESRVAASDWIDETKLLLETRQAAQTITAFSSATGLASRF